MMPAPTFSEPFSMNAGPVLPGGGADSTCQRSLRPTDTGADAHPEVTAAVLGLPPQQRAATYLVYWADQSIQETAALMGVRPGTVKRYLHLARRRIKGVLDAH